MSDSIFNTWYCEKCEINMDQDDFLSHINDVHDITEGKGNRSMLMHMDGRDFYEYKWKWDISGLVFIQHTKNKRDKSDMMYWG